MQQDGDLVLESGARDGPSAAPEQVDAARVGLGAEAGGGLVPQVVPLFSRDFLLVCLTAFSSSMAMQFLLPTLPLYLKSLGGQDTDIGLIFGAYSLSALGSRLVAGPLLDLWGRKRPLLVGALLYLAAQLLYSVTTTAPSVIILRLFHGIGFGIVTTACSALAADLAPPQRRGEALGWYGNFPSVAMAVGPGIGLWLVVAPGLPMAGFHLLFLACNAVVLIELLFVLQIRETHRLAAKRPPAALALRPARLFSRDALPIALAMLFGACTAGAVISFVPVYLATENTGHVPFFFLLYATAMATSRPFVGKVADRFDRRVVAIPSLLLCVCGVSFLAVAPSLPVALISALMFGVGYGSLHPTLLALVVDVVKPQERGTAVGTFIASIDVGIGVGSMMLGVVAQAWGYRWVFLVAGAVGLIGLGYWIRLCRATRRARS